MKQIRLIINWLGPVRSRLFFVLLAITGLVSLILNAISLKENPWVTPVQSSMVAVFLIGTGFIVGSRLPRDQRRRAVIIIAPAIFSLTLAAFLPRFWLLFVPLGLGWLFISFIASQGRVRREYQTAIKHLRNNEYDEAIKVMSDLIDDEPEDADHRRFRAELYRLAGKIKKARADYQKVIELTPESGVGYNGLAEVFLQDGEYEQAFGYAEKAYQIEKDYWVAPYNLGMIEDRLNRPVDSTRHLNEALATNIPDSRHRLLTYLWLIRNAMRQGDQSAADVSLDALKRERDGLKEWKTIFESEQAAVLKVVLERDIRLAEMLIKAEINPSDLLKEPNLA